MRLRRSLAVCLVGGGIAANARAQKPGDGPQTYGTTNTSYIEVPAEAFFPTESTYNYHSGAEATRYTTSCAGLYCFAAPLRLPSGAKIVYLEIDFVDTDPVNSVLGGLTVCDFRGQNCSSHPSAGAGPADCLVPGEICSGNAYAGGPGSQSAVNIGTDGITVDNYLSSYRLYAGTGGDVNTRIAGMIVGYVLQVSPAPGTADFNDVPTSHPFFQFIEALYHAGITGGCQAAPPLYCPDAPLTRGQMAVFLAKGLGLQFP
jgi:hypothetical protein